MYKAYLNDVTFVVLPEDTMFLFDEIVVYDPDQKKPFCYTYVDLEGSGKRDQLVRISKENTEAVINRLAKLINPRKERQEKLIRMVMALRDRTSLAQEHISFLISTIVNESMT